ENEVLKVQLKKYVGAVQMLKREGQTVEALCTGVDLKASRKLQLVQNVDSKAGS
ncbi:UNVERIFIED_CONTAM: hypothetical protein K2H54_016850, partial [Gekko kuhli]